MQRSNESDVEFFVAESFFCPPAFLCGAVLASQAARGETMGGEGVSPGLGISLAATLPAHSVLNLRARRDDCCNTKYETNVELYETNVELYN